MRNLLWIILLGTCWGQYIPVFQGACSTPTGTNFTESFGDSTTSCWTSGPSTCNHTWTVSGSPGQSIGATPGTPPVNTACANSLSMNIPNTTDYISATFTGTTSPFDVKGTLWITTLPASGQASQFLCITTSTGGCNTGDDIVAMSMDNSGGCSGAGLKAVGTGNSSCITGVVTNTWYSFTLHRDATAANCSLAVTGGSLTGSPVTFTCNTGSAAAIYVGNKNFTAANINFTIGNLNF